MDEEWKDRVERQLENHEAFQASDWTEEEDMEDDDNE